MQEGGSKVSDHVKAAIVTRPDWEKLRTLALVQIPLCPICKVVPADEQELRTHWEQGHFDK